VKFEWDPRKARENVRKHGISFEEALTAFADWESITIPDPDHSESERRWALLGLSNRGNLLVVPHTARRIHQNHQRVAGERQATNPI